MVNKTAIAVYNPQNTLEKAIQEASNTFQGKWLSMYQCKLMANALLSLKMIDSNWLENPDLLFHRVEYFFKKEFIEDRGKMVFVTHLLFLRDILENHEIDAYLHSPIILMTQKLAHYFFREYPIHILIDTSIFRSENKKSKMFDVGGFFLMDGENAVVTESILSMDCKEDKEMQLRARPEDVRNVQIQTKAASSLVGDGVFKIDEHERLLMPDTRVWDKTRRTSATIYMVEPGETGDVGILYSDGFELAISKEFFDTRFVVV